MSKHNIDIRAHFNSQMKGYCVYYRTKLIFFTMHKAKGSFLKLGYVTQIFTSFSWNIFSHVTYLQGPILISSPSCQPGKYARSYPGRILRAC